MPGSMVSMPGSMHHTQHISSNIPCPRYHKAPPLVLHWASARPCSFPVVRYLHMQWCVAEILHLYKRA